MLRPFPPSATLPPQSSTHTFCMKVFRCSKPLFLPSSLKVYGIGFPSGERQELQENPKGETKRTLSDYKVLAQKRKE